jgi:hypothetical protein
MILSQDEYLALMDRINDAESSAKCATRELELLTKKYESMEKDFQKRLNVLESKMTSLYPEDYEG